VTRLNLLLRYRSIAYLKMGALHILNALLREQIWIPKSVAAVLCLYLALGFEIGFRDCCIRKLPINLFNKLHIASINGVQLPCLLVIVFVCAPSGRLELNIRALPKEQVRSIKFLLDLVSLMDKPLRISNLTQLTLASSLVLIQASRS
jgi:hypothetical protein